MPDRHAAPDHVPARAIVDIGSNTVRLVIYGGPPRAPAVLHNEKVSARLGKGVAETGLLADKATKVALAALARYRMVIDLLGVKAVDVVATAAVRDAANGSAFLQQVADLGFAPRLLSGEQEAVTSAMGVIGAFPDAAGVVADLGGGSLELVDVAAGSCSHGVSLPLGTLRLPPLRARGLGDFRRHVTDQLVRADWTVDPGTTLYLVGGSFRSFARYALQHSGWPSDDPHGVVLGADFAARQARALARRKGADLASVTGISASRLAALPDAAALLLVLIERLAPARLVFSAWGLREGLVFAGLPAATRAQDPLLAGVATFIGHQGGDPATAAMVAGWTALARPEAEAGTQSEPHRLPASGRERIRLAATMLALASSHLEPNLRADLAVAWALRKRWIGITNRERAMLAAAMLANTGRTDLPAEWQAVADISDLKDAQGWGLAVRLCRRFSASAPQSLSASRLTVEDRLLKLTVEPPYGALVNDGVARDLRALADLLGLKGVCAT